MDNNTNSQSRPAVVELLESSELASDASYDLAWVTVQPEGVSSPPEQFPVLIRRPWRTPVAPPPGSENLLPIMAFLPSHPRGPTQDNFMYCPNQRDSQIQAEDGLEDTEASDTSGQAFHQAANSTRQLPVPTNVFEPDLNMGIRPARAARQSFYQNHQRREEAYFEVDPRADVMPTQALHQEFYQQRPSPEPEMICLCREPKAGRRTIRCSIGEFCLTKEFHLDCIGLERRPHRSESWTCPECSEYASDAGGAGGNDAPEAANSTLSTIVRRLRHDEWTREEQNHLTEVMKELEAENIRGKDKWNVARDRLLTRNIDRKADGIRGQWYRIRKRDGMLR